MKKIKNTESAQLCDLAMNLTSLSTKKLISRHPIISSKSRSSGFNFRQNFPTPQFENIWIGSTLVHLSHNNDYCTHNYDPRVAKVYFVV